VGAIDHDVHALEIQFVWERGLAELDVAPLCIVDAVGPAEVRRFVAADRLLHPALDLGLHRIRLLEAVAREELDAVVGVGIVRSADHHARRQPQCAREVGDARRR